MHYRRKLIQVALPLEAINAESARIDPNNPPFFRVTIPWDQAEQCILNASEALAGLSAKE